MSLTEQELIERVKEWVLRNSSNRVQASPEITGDTNLLAAGLLDSLGFVELITFIEKQEGCRVDLVDADPADFGVIRGLCRLALKPSAM